MKNELPSTSIKQWALDDRPREKLQAKGKSSLSDAELIAILIGSGNRQESAVDLSKRILISASNNLNELGRMGIDELCSFKGIGEAKAISIITALELGRRRRLAEALQRKKIQSSTAAFEILQPCIGDLQHEEFWVIFLSTSNDVIAHQRISVGGITGTLADIRVIFKRAIELQATAIIVAHNHPSGNLKPSTPDINLTKKLKEAGVLVDIQLIDHLIITEKDYFSFADDGLL